MTNVKILLLFLVFLFFGFSPQLLAQNQISTDVPEQAPRIFIDCNRCDIDYIREEIDYVNYVWDRKNAQVHVLITEQQTGGGGREFTLAFIGLQEFSGMSDTLNYTTDQTMTDNEIRAGLVEILGF